MTMQAVVYPVSGVDPSELRDRIEAEVAGVMVMDIGDLMEMLDDMGWMVVAEALLVSALLPRLARRIDADREHHDGIRRRSDA